jgi:hypothetical protein
VPDGARANAWSTPEAADAAKTLHDKNLNEHGWAIESILHPLSADARDDADNMHDYPHAVVDVESIADPAARAAFLASTQRAATTIPAREAALIMKAATTLEKTAPFDCTTTRDGRAILHGLGNEAIHADCSSLPVAYALLDAIVAVMETSRALGRAGT